VAEVQEEVVVQHHKTSVSDVTDSVTGPSPVLNAKAETEIETDTDLETIATNAESKVTNRETADLAGVFLVLARPTLDVATTPTTLEIEGVEETEIETLEGDAGEATSVDITTVGLLAARVLAGEVAEMREATLQAVIAGATEETETETLEGLDLEIEVQPGLNVHTTRAEIWIRKIEGETRGLVHHQPDQDLSQWHKINHLRRRPSRKMESQVFQKTRREEILNNKIKR